MRVERPNGLWFSKLILNVLLGFWDFLECLHKLPHHVTSFYTHIRTAVRTGVVLNAQFALGLLCVFKSGKFHSKNGNTQRVFEYACDVEQTFEHTIQTIFSILVCSEFSCLCIWQRHKQSKQSIYEWRIESLLGKPTRCHF